jgi:hypothetical protein
MNTIVKDDFYKKGSVKHEEEIRKLHEINTKKYGSNFDFINNYNDSGYNSFSYTNALLFQKNRNCECFDVEKSLIGLSATTRNQIYEMFREYFNYIYDEKYNYIKTGLKFIITLNIGFPHKPHASVVIINLGNTDKNKNFVEFYNPWTSDINLYENLIEINPADLDEIIIAQSILITEYLKSKQFINDINEIFYKDVNYKLEKDHFKVFTSNEIQSKQNEIDYNVDGFCALHTFMYTLARTMFYDSGYYSMNYVEQQLDDYIIKINHPNYINIAFLFYVMVYNYKYNLTNTTMINKTKQCYSYLFDKNPFCKKLNSLILKQDSNEPDQYHLDFSSLLPDYERLFEI